MCAKQRYDRSDIRRLNAVNVLDQLRSHGPMSRAKIAAALGLTRATVSNIASDLLETTLIHETEYDEGGPGRPGLLLNLNPNSGAMVAVDMDVERVSVVVANMGQDILWQEQLTLADSSDAESSLAQIVELVDRAMAFGASKDLRCRGVCVAWAGLVSRQDGQLVYGPTSGWQHISVKSDWEARYGVPVHVENEAHAGAIGVHHFGPRPGVRNLVYLSVGAGLAAGVFVDGVLLGGKQGFVGQVGHTHFADNGIECSCGKSGCWVTEVGSEAVMRKLLAAGVDVSSAADADWIGLVDEKVRAGDADAVRVVESVACQLGYGLARLVQTLNPSMVIVGGRLGCLMSSVESVIRDAMLRETLPYMAESLELIVSDSGDDRLRGCLATVFDAVMKNPEIVDL